MLNFNLDNASQTLKQLRLKIDNYRKDCSVYVNGQYQQPRDMLNLLHLSFDACQREIIEPLNAILFDEARFDSLDIVEKTTAIWLYMVVSAYLGHWKNERINTDGPAKSSLFNNNSDQFQSVLNNYVANINHTIRSFRSRNLAQKVLQINGALFHCRRGLNLEQATQSIYFSSSIIEMAQAKAKEPRELGNQSLAESYVNQAVSQNLNGSLFSLLGHGSIDAETGFELDLPLAQRISIETDGPHHYYNQGPHHPVHHFKALCLRELGWVRVPIDATRNDSQQMTYLACQVGNILNTSSIFEYNENYQRLMQQLAQVRHRIVQTSELSKRSRADQKSQLQSNLEDLRAFEKQIVKLIERRDLEKVLVNRNDRSAQSHAQLDAVKKMNQAHQQIESIEQQIASLRQRQIPLKETERSINELKDKAAHITCGKGLQVEIGRLETKCLLNDPRTNPQFEEMKRKGFIDKNVEFVGTLKKLIQDSLSKNGFVKESAELHGYIDNLVLDRVITAKIEALEEEKHKCKQLISQEFQGILSASFTLIGQSLAQAEELLLRVATVIEDVERQIADEQRQAQLSRERIRRRTSRGSDYRDRDRSRSPTRFSTTRGYEDYRDRDARDFRGRGHRDRDYRDRDYRDRDYRDRDYRDRDYRDRDYAGFDERPQQSRSPSPRRISVRS